MSDLNGIEKQRFEKLLGMSGGFVLDFSNRSFAEFISDSADRAIYDSRYERDGTSKANRLREFWRQEENDLVGKLMGAMLEYGVEGGLFTDKDVLLEGCQKIVMRLKGLQAPGASPQVPKDERSAQRSETLARLKHEFFQLHAEADRNKAGFDLEKLVHHLFELFELKPRQSYRVIGEQIDGSFELGGNIYLLESKAEKDALPEAELLIFKGKIEGKSTFTRGVFIALNDISGPARDAITRGKAPSFFVMNGHDVLMILSEAVTLTDFLRHRIRLLGDKGQVCVPFAEVEKEIAMYKKETSSQDIASPARLELAFDEDDPSCVKTWADGQPHHLYRLKVTNRSNTTQHDVRVVIEGVVPLCQDILHGRLLAMHYGLAESTMPGAVNRTIVPIELGPKQPGYFDLFEYNSRDAGTGRPVFLVWHTIPPYSVSCGRGRPLRIHLEGL